MTNHHCRELSLDQGTEEWLAVRREHITATEAAHLWSGATTFQRLRDEKQGKVATNDLSGVPSVQEGKRMEPKIREYLASTFGKLLCPEHGIIPTPTLESAANPRFMASLDGLTEAGLPIEIKNTAHTSDYSVVMQQGINNPTAQRLGYYQQVQWQLMVTGAPEALFVTHQSPDGQSLEPSNIRVSRIPRDEGMIAELTQMAEAFIAYLDGGTVSVTYNGHNFSNAPKSPRVEEIKRELLAANALYEEASARAKELSAKRSALMEQLRDAALNDGETRYEDEALTLSLVERSGSLNTRRLEAELLGSGKMTREQLETFRSPSTQTLRLTVKGE